VGRGERTFLIAGSLLLLAALALILMMAVDIGLNGGLDTVPAFGNN
jgi:hypothetical protein